MSSRTHLSDDIKSKAQDLGSDVADAVRTDVESKAATLRDEAVDRATQAANAADAAGAEFDPASIQAQAADQVAMQIEGFANRLRDTDLNSVTRDISNFARSNPLVFVGGAALLGVAAARFLKARDPQRVDPMASADPWASSTPTGGFDVPS